MHKVQKATIGIRPTEKLFRVASLAGLVADEVIAACTTKPLHEGYFANVTRASGGNQLRLTNETLGYFLIVDVENIVFSHDFYESDKKYNADEFFAAFKVLWGALNSVLKVKRIRRIGFVAEYRFPQKEGASERLLKQLTKLKAHGHPDKFSLTYESRKGTAMGGLPDPGKDDFYNVIRQIYDSIGDTDHSEKGFYNANLDIQRYYSPPLTKEIGADVDAIRREFDKAVNPFFEELTSLGLCNEAAE